jgi:hypothetical protein
MHKLKYNICGCKLVELPYLEENLIDGNVLIVGERNGDEGIIDTVYKKNKEIDCTDIDEIDDGNIVDYYLYQQGAGTFFHTNFLDFPESKKYDNVACINVLEHFGMGWGNKTDLINWNWDLAGIEKMTRLCSGRIIITVPAGPPIFYGDTLESGVPFLRRYDKQRIEIIKSFVEKLNFTVEKEKLFFSPDLVNWQETHFDILEPQYSHHNLYSPNMIYAFCIDCSKNKV